MTDSKAIKNEEMYHGSDSYPAVKAHDEDEIYYQMASIYKEISHSDGQAMHRIFARHLPEYQQNNFMEDVF